ncbi:hypothetical protein SAMN05720468_1191, partial [Fibrobacter sp. UWEL]
TVNTERDKKILEDQVACTISIDEQIGRLFLSHVEGENKGLLKAAEAFLREGDSVERVARVLKLPTEKVQELADKIKNAK